MVELVVQHIMQVEPELVVLEKLKVHKQQVIQQVLCVAIQLPEIELQFQFKDIQFKQVVEELQAVGWQGGEALELLADQYVLLFSL